MKANSKEYDDAAKQLTYITSYNDKTEEVVRFIVEFEDVIRHTMQHYNTNDIQDAIIHFLKSKFGNNFNEKTIRKFLNKKGILSSFIINSTVISIAIAISIVYLIVVYTSSINVFIKILLSIVLIILFFVVWLIVQEIIFERKTFFFKNSEAFKNVPKDGFSYGKGY